MSLLEVDGIAVRYGAAAALHDVSLSVAPGEVVALLGPNGAGKTTTLRAVSATVGLARGAIRFKGSPLPAGARGALRAGIAHCPEGRHVFAHMSVRENLDVGGFTVGDRAARVRRRERLLAQLPRLAERRDQQAGTLSGGEQQMLAIARALMTSPELLLLDEPTMGLAPIMALEIGAIVEGLREQGTSLLLVEESAELALRLADRVFVIDAGRVVLGGTTDELAGSDLMHTLYLGAGAP